MHTASSKWHVPRTKYATPKKKKQMQMMRDKRHLASDTDRAPEKRLVKKKLNSPVDISESDEFIMVHTSFFCNFLKETICSVCSEKCVSASITERNGLCVKLVLYCKNCETVIGENFTSPRMESTNNRQAAFVVNRKAVESTNDIGLGYAALEKFCVNLNIRPPSSRTFRHHLNVISDEAKKLEKKVLEEARSVVKQAYVEEDSSLVNKSVINTKNTYDGTWHRRGHVSKYGVGIVIDMLTNLVVDFEILSKYCHMCTITAAELDPDSPEFNVWFEVHKSSGECNANYEGASGSMEVQAAVNIWSRSVRKNGMRYVTLLSDGDAKTWTRLNEVAPYGKSILIEKEECINHVQKRMGKGLRELATKEKLGGKADGALTLTKINQLQKYYRRAIVNNTHDLTSMQDAIQATLYHCSSTDKKPDHSRCPKGSSSWCFFNKAKALKQQPKSHSSMAVRLSAKVFKKIKPLYERLSNAELLRRCLRGGTQNVNEGLHAQIWRKCPKEVFVSKKRVHLAVINAVMEHNVGILEARKMRALSRNERLSDLNQEMYTRMDQVRSKRKADQGEYRHSKRSEKLHCTKKPRQAKCTDYGAGEH